MRWTERQRAMLAAMGVRLWERETVTSAAADLPADVAVESAVETVEVAGTATVADPRADVRGAVPIAASPSVASVAAPAAADWLFVGEPLDEVQAQLLDNMLRAIGVARNAPMRAHRAAVLALADRPAGAAADAGVGERLRVTVAAVRPRCIVALGRSAAQALLSTDEPLGALRGRSHMHAGIAVVVTCPLAFLLRHPEEKAKAWADLCLAVIAADAAPGEPGDPAAFSPSSGASSRPA
ncbi:MAG: uracil-DNA glycosylase family protein [Caldimonas sp.]